MRGRKSVTGGNAARPQRRLSPSQLRRTKSVPAAPESSPPSWRSIKGIMKLRTLDESLGSKYGLDASTSSREKIHIKFQNIEVREYGRTIGDNPSVSSGPPMTISWEYNPDTKILSVEEFEKNRPTRRTQSEMVLPRSLRIEMLRKEWGVSQSQIARAVRSGVRAKSQRRTTLGNLGKTEKMEELIEGATKQLLKSLFLRKSTSKRAQELGDKIQSVKQQQKQLVLEHLTEGEYSDSSYSQSPWAAELLPDESDAYHQSQETIFESDIDGSPTIRQHPSLEINLTNRILASSGSDSSSRRDDAPKKPPRPEPSDSEVGDLSDSTFGDENESEPITHDKQSTGESARQNSKSYKRPNQTAKVTATEPDDDELPPLPIRARKQEVEC